MALPYDEVHVDELLRQTIQAGCDELHLRSRQPPSICSHPGSPFTALSGYGVLTPLDLQQMIYAILTDEQIVDLERDGELVFTYSVARLAGFGIRVINSHAEIMVDFSAVPDRG